MRLTGIETLYRSMMDASIDRYRFNYKHGRATFDVFFFIDESPFVLLFGTRGENFYFEVAVAKGFQISTTLNPHDFKELCRVLRLEYNPDNRFSTHGFFEDFNAQIPGHIAPAGEVRPHELAKYRSIAEEADKVYFLGWRNNQISGDHVSQTNLDKTRLLLGLKAFNRCSQKNISSRWTDNPQRAVKFYMPD